MKLLHTADWHLGKRLYGVDRLADAAEVLGEVTAIAEREAPDAIIVAGDLLDRRPVDAEPLGICLDALAALAEVAPVLAVTGNHDDEAFWGHLGPWLTGRGITLGHRVDDAREAVRTIETAAGPLHAGLVPWPSPADLEQPHGTDAGNARRRYTEWVTASVVAIGDELRRRSDAGGATALIGHLMISGARTGGGERELSVGPASALAGSDLPDVDYTALGHIHLPQAVPGAPGAAFYSGSPMALDFSESADAKRVVVAEIAGGETTVRDVPLTSGRQLIRLRGPLEGLAARAAEHPGALFSCEVEVEEIAPDLARRVRTIVPDAIRIEPVHDAVDGVDEENREPDVDDAGLAELYAEWHAREARPLSEAQADAFRQAIEAAG